MYSKNKISFDGGKTRFSAVEVNPDKIIDMWPEIEEKMDSVILEQAEFDFKRKHNLTLRDCSKSQILHLYLQQSNHDIIFGEL